METFKTITFAITTGVLALFVFTVISIAIKLVKDKKIDIRGIGEILGR